MKFHGYHLIDPDGFVSESCLLQAGHAQEALLTEGMRRVWECDASSWEEAKERWRSFEEERIRRDGEF